MIAGPLTTELCFACNRTLGAHPHRVDTRDDQTVFVGSECFKRVQSAGDSGWQPPKGGPRLFLIAGPLPPQDVEIEQ